MKLLFSAAAALTFALSAAPAFAQMSDADRQAATLADCKKQDNEAERAKCDCLIPKMWELLSSQQKDLFEISSRGASGDADAQAELTAYMQKNNIDAAQLAKTFEDLSPKMTEIDKQCAAN